MTTMTAILNFHFAIMPPIMFQLIPTIALAGDGKCEKHEEQQAIPQIELELY